MVEHVFNTHSFLHTLSTQDVLENYSLYYLNAEGREEKIIISQVIVTSSHIMCRVITQKGEKRTLNIFRIRKIYHNNELVWDNSEQDLSTFKTIEGY